MNQCPGTPWNRFHRSNQSGHRHVSDSLKLVGFWLKMPPHSAGHFSPSRNSIRSLKYMWPFHCEGVTRYEPKTSFGLSESDSVRVPSRWRQVREDGPNLHVRWERTVMREPNPRHQGSSQGRAGLGGRHTSQKGYTSRFISYVPSFFLG